MKACIRNVANYYELLVYDYVKEYQIFFDFKINELKEKFENSNFPHTIQELNCF